MIPFFLQDDSLQINIQRNQILSTNRFSTIKLQHNRSFRFPPFKTDSVLNDRGVRYAVKQTNKQTNKQKYPKNITDATREREEQVIYCILNNTFSRREKQGGKM